jgi:integrase
MLSGVRLTGARFLGMEEFWGLIDAAGSGTTAQAAHDRALVALHSFTGLRPEETVRLRWEHLSTELTARGHYGLTATVERRGCPVSLL